MAIEFTEIQTSPVAHGRAIPLQRTANSDELTRSGMISTLPMSSRRASAASWRDVYVRRLRVTDALVLVAAVVVAQVARFGGGSATLEGGAATFSYTTFGLVIAGFWWLSLQIGRSWSSKHLGDGPEEYRRVAQATSFAFGWIAIASVVFKLDFSRAYLAIAFPLGLIGLIAGRKFWRVLLRHRRLEGRHLDSVLVVGGPRSGARIGEWLSKHPVAGFRVSGVWTPGVEDSMAHEITLDGVAIPHYGSDTGLMEAVSLSSANTVLVSDTEVLGHDGLNALTWQLFDQGIDLMLSPNVSGVVGSRIQVRDVSGMPLLHLEEPQYRGASRFAKNAFDRIGALALIVAFSPILLFAAIAVRRGDRGPIFYRQERIGLEGQPFMMTKFRTMVVGADTMLDDLADRNESDAVMFKIREDPRVTKIGRLLRRYSLDELPQLFDVLRGEMSLVGPRPSLPHEVSLYPAAMHRRLLVRPGMTGLWQVSGRSDLSFDDSVRLDLHYVENWSIVGDILILVKTVKAVASANGAY